MVSKILIILFLLISLTFPIFAQSQNENEKLDEMTTNEKIYSINKTQKGNSKELNINDENLKKNPLANRKLGIEINLFRLLFFSSKYEDMNHSFSGGVSLFNIDRHAEITFQIYYIYYTIFDYYCDVNKFNFGEIPLQQFILDCHYRRFLGKTQKGFYISGFIRYANLRGMKKEDLYNYCHSGGEEPKLIPENKLGIGFGIGYRIFSHKGFYWGVSLNIGRYFIGENNIFYHKWYDPVGPEDLLYPTNDVGIIYSFELFKFGWAF